MGAKTWMLVYADRNVGEVLKGHPQLDREATLKLANRLFPQDKLDSVGDGDFLYTCPPDDELRIGCFPGISIVAAGEFAIDYPSQLPEPFVAAGGSGMTYLHVMHSVVDWFAYAQWTGGRLVRSLSLSPDTGILEDIGQRLPFEEPFWSGHHRAIEDDVGSDYPFPFHPLELGEAALKEFFGYQLEGSVDPELLEPETIPLVIYRRSKSS